MLLTNFSVNHKAPSRTGSDASWPATRRGHGIFGNNPAGRDLADFVVGLLGEPQSAVRTGGNALQIIGDRRGNCVLYNATASRDPADAMVMGIRIPQRTVRAKNNDG
jgi:hypothetical protein